MIASDSRGTESFALIETGLILEVYGNLYFMVYVVTIVKNVTQMVANWLQLSTVFAMDRLLPVSTHFYA